MGAVSRHQASEWPRLLVTPIPLRFGGLRPSPREVTVLSDFSRNKLRNILQTR